MNLTELYNQWNENDEKFAEVSTDFSGVRILRQDPTENLFAHICSSNNTISRISGMVEKLCSAYGQFLLEVNMNCPVSQKIFFISWCYFTL